MLVWLWIKYPLLVLNKIDKKMLMCKKNKIKVLQNKSKKDKRLKIKIEQANKPILGCLELPLG